jgi:16S rRNA (cytidine1402-2'-O)-methyltransferase
MKATPKTRAPTVHAAEARGTLFVIGTPIGNLGDLSPRARDVLAKADVIAAEDTRRTRGLLSRIGINARVIAYHEHNEEKRVPELLTKLASGQSIALVSDAGTPLISDPGLRLVRAAHAQGIDVSSIPGPSAVMAALSVAGLATDRFVFEGFLPRRAAARAEHLRSLSGEPRTMVFFEAVHRLADTLQALIAQFGADRPAAVARELTKVHEQLASGTLGQLQTRLGADIPLLGEFVLLVAGSSAHADPDEQRVRSLFALLSAELTPKKAVSVTAAITGLPRNTIYRLTRIHRDSTD